MSDRVDRVDLPVDTGKLVLDRKLLGMRRSNVAIGDDGNLDVSGEAEYKVMVRKAGRSGEKAISSRAKKLASCKGLKGCDFAECALDAMGRLPANLMKMASSCPTLGIGIETGIEIENIEEKK